MPGPDSFVSTPPYKLHPPSSIPGLKTEPQSHTFDTGGYSTESHNGRITDGKQKAKAVVAAHLVGDSVTGQSQPRQPPTSGASNQMSRKRSRSGSRIPSMSRRVSDDAMPSVQDLLYDQYTTRDQNYTATLKEQAEHREALIKGMNDDIQLWKDLRKSSVHDPGRIYGEGFAGYGNGWTAQYPTKVIYPAHRKRPGSRRTRELRFSRRDRVMVADQIEELIPIRLDLELEKLRIRDTFTWNAYDRVVGLDVFAEGLVEDLKVPPESGPGFTQQVIQSMHEQIQEHHPHPFIEDEPLDPHLPYSAYKNDEIRVLIKLNITIGQHTLMDQFDWDINNRLNSPEDFAMRMSHDLSLSGEFRTAIAHSIHEQTQMFSRSLFITGHHFDGRPVEDTELRENLLPSPLPSSFRAFATVKEYTPYFWELNDADLERAELAVSRDQRHLKRAVNRRGGPTVPDLKERLGTARTLVVSSVIPGAADNIEQSGLFKPVRAPSGRGRRPFKNDRGDDSEVSESEDSEVDSPARNPIAQGTARTRGIRGAASAAAAAMRASLAGSMTPDASLLHHEPRAARRTGGYDYREDSMGEPSLMLRLKMPRAKYRVWWRNYKEKMADRLRQQQILQQQQQRRQASQTPQGLAAGFIGSRASTPQYGTPAPSGNMPPPSSSTPGFQQRPQQPQPGFGGRHQPTRSVDGSRQQQKYPSLDGADDVPPAPSSSTPVAPPPAPAPPLWLTNALNTLSAEHPHDSFEATMRYNPDLQEWQPRIRCNDCTGMAYNTFQTNPTGNFRVHLSNARHLERRLGRIGM